MKDRKDAISNASYERKMTSYEKAERTRQPHSGRLKNVLEISFVHTDLH